MAETKHTPGPWRSFVNDPDSPADGFVIDSEATNENIAVTSGDEGRDFDEALANAKLIAAAPALADALRNAVRLIAGIGAAHGANEAADKMLVEARAALRAAGRLP